MGNGIEKQRQESSGVSRGPTIRIQNGTGVEKITHALVYQGVGPCEGCGKWEGSFRHATYKYVVDERYGVTTRVPQLWCGEGCCPCCIEEKKTKEKGREAVHV